MMRGEEEPYDDQAAQLLASAQRLRDSAAPLPERLQAIKEIHRTAGTSIGWGGGLRSVLRHDMLAALQGLAAAPPRQCA